MPGTALGTRVTKVSLGPCQRAHNLMGEREFFKAIKKEKAIKSKSMSGT